jgi:quinolinate synthase
MSSDSIGCSLAEAAESESYNRYLEEASHTPTSLHVVYINTSLRTKATAHSLVPTITCTSSNVVQTVLQGFAQVRGEGRDWAVRDNTWQQDCTVADPLKVCGLCCASM